MAQTNVFDLSEMEQAFSATAEMPVLHPVTGNETGAFIVVYGPDSEESQNLDAKMADRRLSKIQSRGGHKISSTELKEMALEKLVGLTKELKGFQIAGKPYESTKTNMYDLYKKNPWLREQVQEFLEDRRNFFKG